MFDGHALLRSEKVRAGATAAFGLLLLLKGSMGIRIGRSRYYSRPWHSPFAFEDYAWTDWLFTFAGLGDFAGGVPVFFDVAHDGAVP
ncbi:MAG: hypothetical protein ABL997_19065 [Planctomycetota bacterium]